ncbi:MAG TPA: TIGR02206 family membrane protein [Terriglobales bacterium]|nr:TIGR02206 family membrane protein [Terriglobales bacterium]
MTTALDLSTGHLTALATVVAATAVLCAAARRRPGRWTLAACAALGALTFGAEAAWIVWLARQGGWTPAVGLPLQLCDAATVLAAAALWSRRRVLVEVLWFWAMAGTVQALLTPDIPDPYPSFLWFQYYVAHGGVVAAALFLVAGLGIAPRRGAALRAAALTAAYAAVVGAVDVATGGDYLYLRSRPLHPSLLDVMGPWPWYLLSATALAIVLFALLQAPFASGPRRRAQVLPPEIE